MKITGTAATDPGDDSAVMRAYLRWEDSVEIVTRAEHGRPSGAHVWRAEGVWTLVFAVDRGPTKRQRHFVEVDPDGTRPDRWALKKFAPGVWDVPMSIHAPGQFHGFVTILNVPNPAPWEPVEREDDR